MWSKGCSPAVLNDTQVGSRKQRTVMPPKFSTKKVTGDLGKGSFGRVNLEARLLWVTQLSVGEEVGNVTHKNLG